MNFSQNGLVPDMLMSDDDVPPGASSDQLGSGASSVLGTPVGFQLGAYTMMVGQPQYDVRELGEQLRAKLQGNKPVISELVEIMKKMSQCLPPSSLYEFEAVVRASIETAVESSLTGSIDNVLLPILSFCPAVLESCGILSMFPRGCFGMPQWSQQYVRSMGRKWTNDMQDIKYRCAVYYKPRAANRPTDLSWMVLALDYSQFEVIPLREEGTPAFSAKDRKLIPLEVHTRARAYVCVYVCAYIYTCVCMYVYICIYMYHAHTYIHTYINTYIHIYIRT